MRDLFQKYFADGEDWDLLCQRVSGIMPYNTGREKVYHDLLNMNWLPNSPTLVNAGKPGGRNLMACHALHISDSIEGIFKTARDAAMIFKAGGGLGLELSALTSRGTPLRYAPQGKASGPVSFLKVFDVTAQVVMEGGLRRAAMLASLNSSHPDILEFISCKKVDKDLSNFNITITVDDGPDSVKREVWEAIVTRAWFNGEPGVGYLDLINETNPTLQEYGRIIALNACAELPLHDGGSCVLGSLVLPNIISGSGDLTKLEETTETLVKFLNRVVDVNNYPLPKIAQATRRTRSIGVGVMGFATLLERENIPYTSGYAIELADEIGSVIHRTANEVSWSLADKHGGYLPGRRRNDRLTAIAPTGHISRLAGVSFSIYPEFEDALAMTPEQHLDMLATWQKHVDSSISYTVNIQSDTEPSLVDRIFRMAYERGIKVVSVYRDGSRKNQPCTIEGKCEM